MSAAGVQLNVVPFEANKAIRLKGGVVQTGEFIRNTPNISCVNADQVGALVSYFGLRWDSWGYHVGFWAWELEDFPRTYVSSANLLDEVWTISNFSAKAISNSISTQVKFVKVPVPLPSKATPLSKRHFGLLDSDFVITTSFDFNSDMRRKNPEGAIKAFLRAFPKSGSAKLFVKSINADKYPSELGSLIDISNGRKDIIFFDGHLSPFEYHGLLELSDIFLSLHRSEGYGLNMADAMARRTPVIATGYSGNLDYMDKDSSILVPFEKIPVTKYAGLRVDTQWADPDLEFASQAILQLFHDPERALQLGHEGFEKVKNENSLAVTVKRFQKEFMNA